MTTRNSTWSPVELFQGIMVMMRGRRSSDLWTWWLLPAILRRVSISWITVTVFRRWRMPSVSRRFSIVSRRRTPYIRRIRRRISRVSKKSWISILTIWITLRRNISIWIKQFAGRSGFLVTFYEEAGEHTLCIFVLLFGILRGYILDSVIVENRQEMNTGRVWDVDGTLVVVVG